MRNCSGVSIKDKIDRLTQLKLKVLETLNRLDNIVILPDPPAGKVCVHDKCLPLATPLKPLY